MRRIHAYVVAGVLLAAASFPGAAEAHKKRSTTDPFQVVSVTVLNATTADVTFTNQLVAETTDVSKRHFYGEHLDYDVPHTHEVSSVALVNDGKTARLTFSRALHPEEPPCDEPLPKCSDDEIPLIIQQVADIHGNIVSDDEWEIWDTGAEK